MKLYRLRKISFLSLIFTCFGTHLYSADLDPQTIAPQFEDQEVAVLQKRFFHKALRPEIGISYGALLNEAYTRTEKRGLRFGMFLNEWVGFEGQYISDSVSSSADRKALNELRFKKADPKEGEDPDRIVTPQPEINRIHKTKDLSFVAAPFYGKVNFGNLFVLYTDTYLTSGIAKISTDQGDLNSFLLGFGQRYYFHNSWTLRLDFKNYRFTEQRSNQPSVRNQQSWDIGLGWFCW